MKVVSEEHRKNLSLSLKGNKNALGTKRSEEQKDKLRGNKNALGAKRSKETRKKMSEAKIGNDFAKYRKTTKHTEESKKKMSESHTGKVLSPEHRAKAIKNLNRDKGEKSHFWKGGVSNDAEHVRALKTKNKHDRRAREKNNGGSFTVNEWQSLKKEYNFTCPCCRKKEPNIKLTVDHIIPIVKGGSNYIANIQPLCGKCNSSKGTSVIYYSL